MVLCSSSGQFIGWSTSDFVVCITREPSVGLESMMRLSRRLAVNHSPLPSRCFFISSIWVILRTSTRETRRTNITKIRFSHRRKILKLIRRTFRLALARSSMTQQLHKEECRLNEEINQANQHQEYPHYGHPYELQPINGQENLPQHHRPELHQPSSWPEGAAMLGQAARH